jgi:dUTPase
MWCCGVGGWGGVGKLTDEDYRGVVHVLLFNHGQEDFSGKLKAMTTRSLTPFG